MPRIYKYVSSMMFMAIHVIIFSLMHRIYKFYKNLILINPCVFLSYSIKTQDTDENYILWFKAIKVFVFDHIFSNLMWNRRIFLFKRFYNHDLALTIELFPVGSDGKASACNVGDPGLIPGSGRSPGEGNGNPFQYSCLESSMDGGAW